MGNSSSKTPLAEALKIKDSVLDLSSFIKTNGYKFNEENKNDMHRRLINYSNRLQEINTKVTDKKYKEEITKCIKDISNVITQLLKIKINEESLDLASVETSSFVKLPATPNKRKEKEPELKITKQKPLFSSKEKLNYDNKKTSSLNDIQNKLKSVKSDIETYLNTLDFNQLMVQEKVIEILATDLELLNFEKHGPLQETKESVEKELSMLYRKIQRAKNQMQRRSNDLGYLQELQKKDKLMAELKKINEAVAEKYNIAEDCMKNGDFKQLENLKNDILQYRNNLNNIKSKMEDIVNYKSSVKRTIDQMLNEINEKLKEQKSQEGQVTNKNLEDLNTIETCIKQTLESAHENKSTMNDDKYTKGIEYLNHLLEIINKVTDNNENVQNKKENCKKLLSENLNVLKEMYNKFKAAAQQIEQEKLNVKENEQKKQSEKNEAAQKLQEAKINSDLEDLKTVDNCVKQTLENFNKNKHSMGDSVYIQGIQYLNQLLDITDKITNDNEKVRNKKDDTKKYLLESLNVLKKMHQQFTTDQIQQQKKLDQENQTQKLEEKPVIREKEEHSVILRKKSPPNKSVDHQRNIDGFYSYWIDIKQNLISENCSNDEKNQILKLLEELSKDIQAKHQEINQTGVIVQETEQDLFTSNKNLIDNIDNTKIKTRAKVYNIDSKRSLVITDPRIFSNIEVINRQPVEKVIIKDEKPEIFPKPNKTKWTTQDSNKITSQQQVESITQIQTIDRNVEYLKEKAYKFSGAKQTPNYNDIKNKLDNYRKTLNLLISYQNENITLSCNRVLENIDSVMNILHSKIDDQISSLQKSSHRNTIEGIFDKIFDIKTQVDHVNLEVHKLTGTEEQEINNINKLLLGFKTELNNMKTSGYSTISNSKSDVLKDIDDVLYNLNVKIIQNAVVNEDETCKVIRRELRKCKDKINRFSGTYQNILYKEIEKSLNNVVNQAVSKNNPQFTQEITNEATSSLKILEQKAVKDNTYGQANDDKKSQISSNNYDENQSTEYARRISQIRRNLTNIQNDFQIPKEDSWDYFKEMEVKVNLNIVDLDNLNIKQNEPLYNDKEDTYNKLVELSKIIGDKLLLYKENNNSLGDIAEYYKSDISQQLHTLEKEIMQLHEVVKLFKNSKTSTEYCSLIENLKNIHSQADKMTIQPDSVHYERRTILIENINKVWIILSKNAEIYEALSYYEAEITKLNQNLDNFTGEIGDDNYNQMGEKLLSLKSEMKNFNVNDLFKEKKGYLERLLEQVFQKFQEKSVSEGIDSDSSDGTLV